jgi:hypothetical protein
MCVFILPLNYPFWSKLENKRFNNVNNINGYYNIKIMSTSKLEGAFCGSESIYSRRLPIDLFSLEYILLSELKMPNLY